MSVLVRSGLIRFMVSIFVFVSLVFPQKQRTNSQSPEYFATEEKSDNRIGSFPIGLYSVSKKDMEKVSKLGVNIVQDYFAARYHKVGYDYTSTKEYLDEAERLGLKVMLSIDGHYLFERAGSRYLQELNQFVDAFKEHPALGSWNLYDEPDHYQESQKKLKQCYDAIKTKTPSIPVAIVTTGSLEATKRKPKSSFEYFECCDIMLMDNYPVKASQEEAVKSFPLAPLGDFSERVEAYINKANQKPIIPIMQAKKFKPFNSNRFPVREELRYWSFSSISEGVSGLFWYSWYESTRDKRDTAFRSIVLEPHISEVADFVGMISGGASTQLIVGDSVEGITAVHLGVDSNNSYLLVINHSANEIKDGLIVKENWEGMTSISPIVNTRDCSTRLLSGVGLWFSNINPYEVLIFKMNYE